MNVVSVQEYDLVAIRKWQQKDQNRKLKSVAKCAFVDMAAFAHVWSLVTLSLDAVRSVTALTMHAYWCDLR